MANVEMSAAAYQHQGQGLVSRQQKYSALRRRRQDGWAQMVSPTQRYGTDWIWELVGREIHGV